MKTAKINGLMIDTSRLMEKHGYYFRLVDFMADWGMNTLMWHFTDDQGCGISLPGFGHIAMNHAFSAAEARRLIAYARRRGIDVIPELESFGHTKFLTGHPKYADLLVSKPHKWSFNAIDPHSPKTFTLMEQLIASICEVFPSEYFHIGCDEVNLADYCAERGLDPVRVWADYVNMMIELVRRHGRTPLFWVDPGHPDSDRISFPILRKDAVAVEWSYDHRVKDDCVRRLIKGGFKHILTAPAISSYANRFLPGDWTQDNVGRQARYAKKYNLDGVLTTVWLPSRYPQGALYYGVAWAAAAAANGGKFDNAKFNERFGKKVFGRTPKGAMKEFLDKWIRLHIPTWLLYPVCQGGKIKPKDAACLRKAARIGGKIIPPALKCRAARNDDIWRSMLLGARCAWLFARAFVLSEKRASADKKTAFRRDLAAVKKDLLAEWDRTRFPDDPVKLGKKGALIGWESRAIGIIDQLAKLV
ncbi:MAG: family 20 glycosylhydrolase [Planctomycetes bacterium]|nr:family 20 glycosylhydrolase [Planctomycetota bacterium]